MHEVLVNRLGGLSLPRKSVVRLTDRPDMTLDVYRGRKTTIQQYAYFEKDLRNKIGIVCNYKLTLKAPNKNLQQTTLSFFFFFLLLSFDENKAWCFM